MGAPRRLVSRFGIPSLATCLVATASLATAGLRAKSAQQNDGRDEARVELGRRLFFDPRISRAGMRSCADCHDPDHGFSDRDAKSIDDFGPMHRHAQTLIDAHANPSQHWDGAFARIEDVITARLSFDPFGGYGSCRSLEASSPPPPLVDDPSREETLRRDLEPPGRRASVDGSRAASDSRGSAESASEVDRFVSFTAGTSDLPPAGRVLESAGRYREAFRAAFGTPEVSVERVAVVIAAYCATIESGPSPYDRFVAGDATAMNAAARRGLALFRGRARCAQCHVLSDGRASFTDGRFHDTGVSWRSIGGVDAKTERVEPPLPLLPSGRPRPRILGDGGAGERTGAKKDVRAFRTPTLRDVARRGPYMHDGSLATLGGVVEHYRSVALQPGPARDPALDRVVRTIEIAGDDAPDLVAFLRALTSDERPGLARRAWDCRAGTTRLRFVDDAGKPLAGVRVVLASAGDRLPGARPDVARERVVATDRDGFVSFAPGPWTHTRIVIGHDLEAVGGSLVPDTCREATIRVRVVGRAVLTFTLPADVVPPERIEALHTRAKFFPQRRYPRTVLQRVGVVGVGGRQIVRFEAPCRTDVPPSVQLDLPGLGPLAFVELFADAEIRLDLTK
jgi:cytochrome c peroxidase